MRAFKVLLLIVALLSAFQPSLAILDCLEPECITEEGDERVSSPGTELAEPSTRQRRSRAAHPSTRAVARLCHSLRIVRSTAPAALTPARPSVPIPLIC